MKCYERVPNIYFTENFSFNFEYLNQDRKKINITLEKV